MHENHETMVMRAGYGKFTGFIFGLLGLIIMIYALPNLGWGIRFGTLFYSINLGLLVGILNVDIKHPVFPFEFKWWLMGPMMGAWFNFTLMLFIGDAYEKILSQSETFLSSFSSPLWMILDGAIAGMIVSIIVHRMVKD